jgi:hypothetical protein
MDKLSQLACRVANKVALSMLYGETTSGRAPARQMVQEAIDATCDLLDRINPVELRDWFEQFQTIYLKVRTDLVEDPVQWSRFLGSQCDLLHHVKLHQKTIANVGDRLAQWDRNPVTFDEFAVGLDGLSGLVSDHAVVLGSAIEREAGREAKLERRADLFIHSVCGLTIVLVAINQAIVVGDPRDNDCAALATFGASLTNSSVKHLFQACELTWA